jgi:hypothetical protein
MFRQLQSRSLRQAPRESRPAVVSPSPLRASARRSEMTFEMSVTLISERGHPRRSQSAAIAN